MQIETLAARYKQNPVQFLTKVHNMMSDQDVFVAPELNEYYIKSGTEFSQIPREEGTTMIAFGCGRIQAIRHLEQRKQLQGAM